MAPVLGAAWSANPYSYAGNDPMHAIDPLGLRPATDEDLAAYRDANQGVIGAVRNWADEHLDVISAVAIGVGIGASIALMCTPVGPLAAIAVAAAGGAAFAGGISIQTNKGKDGKVDWGKVGVDTAIGGLLGAFGGAGVAAGARVAQTASNAGRVGRAVVANMSVNGGVGAVGSGASYSIYNQDNFSWRGLAGSMVRGGISSSLGGVAGPTGGTLAKIGIPEASSATAARIWSAGIGGGGSMLGGWAGDKVGGDETSGSDLLWDGSWGVAGTFVPGGPTQSSTLNQFGRFAPSTVEGLFSNGANAVRTWTSAGVGATLGVGSDGMREALKSVGGP